MADETTAPGASPPNEVHVGPLRGSKRRPRPLRNGDEHVDRVLAELAGAQHGVVAAHQLVAVGIGRRLVACRLERGALHPVHRGVYSVGHSVVSAMGRWMAATLALGPGAVLSHRAAGELWGIVPRSGRAIEVTRPTTARRRERIVPHRSALPDDELTAVDGIPVTTVPRTVLDLAAVESRRRVERALNEVEVRGLTDGLSIPDLLDRYPGRRGTAVLRDLLGVSAEADGLTRSVLEERFVELLDAYGLPRPRLNADIAARGRFFCVDCVWRDERLIVELDGRATHGTRQAFELDRERDRLLMLDGWRVIRLTWRQLQNQPPSIANDLRKALTPAPGARSTFSP